MPAMKAPFIVQLRDLQSRFRNFVTFFPFQGYFLAFIICSILGQLWLQRQLLSEPSAFNDILLALNKLVVWVVMPLLLLGFISVIIPYIILWFTYRKRKLQVSLQSPAAQPSGLKQELWLSITPLLQPLLGHLYFKMVYDKGKCRSPKFSLVRKENAIGYAGKKQEGWYRWPLPGIREYEIDSMVIYMEDFFHFFKLALPVRVNQSFFTRPPARNIDPVTLQPTQTEQEVFRIKDWRKVQGEWMHYKNFESNDDVRRIVWKIYARNKELVVRTPEILNPFASHISFNLSFYDHIDLAENPTLKGVCLDFYKSACYALYKNLQQQGMQIRFHADCDIPPRSYENEQQRIEFAIALSKWQNIKRPSEWMNSKDATVICLSSLDNPNDVDYFAENGSKGLTIAFFPLSKAIQTPGGWKGLEWLWIEKEKEPALRTNPVWFLSSARRTMLDNEKRIIHQLKQSEIRYIIMGLDT